MEAAHYNAYTTILRASSGFRSRVLTGHACLIA